MAGNIDKFNKQIASFIVFGAVLSSPVMASDNNLIADASLNIKPGGYHEIIAKYAAPQIPIGEIKPLPVDPQPFPVISMYAAPQIPIDPKPIQINPPMLRYAAPQFFIKEQIPQPKPLPELNESSLNINNTKVNNFDKTAKLDTNLKKDVANLNNNTQTQGFVYTEYGSVQVIEPFAHFVFK